jgi:hypothetical protein
MNSDILPKGCFLVLLVSANHLTISAAAAFAALALFTRLAAWFGLAFALVNAGGGMAPGWRAVIGGVKPRTFKNDPHRLINLAQRLFVTFRTACQGGVAELLLAVELYTATFATIRVYWHTTPQLCWLSGDWPYRKNPFLCSLAYLLNLSIIAR